MNLFPLAIIGIIGYVVVKGASGGSPPGIGTGFIATGDQIVPVGLARADLYKRLWGSRIPSIAEAQGVTVVSVESVTWPDASLGTPGPSPQVYDPGRMYAQVLTPGYRIVLSAQGRNYEYHTNQSGSSVALVGG